VVRGKTRWGLLLIAALLAALAALPQTASAVLSGVNGRIVFVSGRGQANDDTAKLFLRPTIGSIGAGTAEPIPTATGAGQHRHPTWSPDRTKIAYAEGPTTGANFDIFVLDLTDPNATPQNITNSNNVTDDRPAWSPDGTRIAFESENADPGANDPPNQLNVKIYDVQTGNTDNFTPTTAGGYEHKPAWTPDSQTLYYVIGNPGAANEMRIFSTPADANNPTPITPAGAPAEFQPSISPDGTKMCYTRGTQQGSSDSRVVLASANPGVGFQPLPGASSGTSYNCTWSPDGTKIAYALGAFTNGDLWMENSDATGNNFLPLETTTARFDGNPDWAPDGRPACEDETVNTPVNTPVSIPLSCPDSGPAYEQTEVRAFAVADPANGTISPGLPDPPVLLPGSITYTPNAGFTGTDSFQVRSFDLVAFGDRDGTITINVQPPPAKDRNLTFDANKNKVKKGKKVTLSGQVNAAGNDPACEAGQTVELQRKRPKQTTFTTFAQVQSNGQGDFSLKKKLKKTTEFRAQVPASANCEDALSGTEKVKVKKKKKR
jgi:dipeptidyl aminopeptidase/acylaminoacyl peptidase